MRSHEANVGLSAVPDEVAAATLAVMPYPEAAKPLLLLRLALLLPALAILGLIGLPSPYGAICAVLAVALLGVCLFVAWRRRQARADE